MEITVEETRDSCTGARIKVIGVGGGGSNMINHILRSGAHDQVELIAANTDSQALDGCASSSRIQLGNKLTKGLGAGMKPEVGRESAIECYDEIKEMLVDADIVFIAAGLGGGTGTGAAPVIAQAAKETGALTISVVTKPFRFEGNKRSRLAEQGLAELKKESDSIVVIPNDKLLSIIEKSLGIKESFKIVDDVLARAVNGMSAIILNHGDSDINMDFADVRTAMSHRGLALMGIGECSGSNAAYEAIKSAIESPLFDNMSINGAMGVLVHFDIHSDYPLTEISDAMQIIYDSADEEADVIFGTTTSSSQEPDRVKITIVATGFEKELVRSDDSRLKLLRPHVDEVEHEEQKATKATQIRKVSGGYEENEDILDIPTFMRKQMD